MEMPVSHSIYTEIQKKNSVWKIKRRCEGNHKTLCQYRKVDIIAGAVCKDHVHLSVAIPPKESISDFMGYLKGKSTLMFTIDIQSCKANGTKLFGREDTM